MRTLLVLAVLLGACAHTPNLPLRPDPAPPAGSTTETFTARDGTPLLMRTWKPEGAPRATIVIMHGLKDYSARYAAFASTLADRGYAVYAFDLRGHGRSAGPRVAPDEWHDYVDDLDRFLTLVEQREPGRPVYLFGHSMGGAIAALTAERHAPKIAGLILSGPALAVDAPPLLIAVTRFAGATTPHAPALALDNHAFSSDPAAGVAMDHDELVSQPPGPARTAAGLVEGMHEIFAGADALTMPVLLLHGTADKLTAPSGSRALYDRIAHDHKELHIYPGAFHDLLHEPAPTGPRVEGDIVAWLDRRAPRAGDTEPPADARAFVAPSRPERYAGPLAGDPRGYAQAVEITAGAGQADGATRFAGSFALQIARPAPIGLAGALTARMAGGDYRALSLRPLGVAARAGAAVVGISGGVALVTGTHFAYSGGGWLELPAGPLHVGASAEWSRLFRDAGGAAPLSGDLLWTSATLRAGGDRAYWPGAHAGVGPALSGGAEWVGDQRGWFFTVGLQLYGAD